MSCKEYARLLLEKRFGNGGDITEWQAMEYVAAIMNFLAAGSRQRRELARQLR